MNQGALPEPRSTDPRRPSGPGGRERRDSTLVTVLCGLALALAFLALGSNVIPFVGGGLALLISAFAILLSTLCLALALGRHTKLVLPVIALLASGAPAAKKAWHEARTVWVESDDVCYAPRMRASVFGILLSVAQAADRREAVGKNICSQLGKEYAESDCDKRPGRIKCEP